MTALLVGDPRYIGINEGAVSGQLRCEPASVTLSPPLRRRGREGKNKTSTALGAILSGRTAIVRFGYRLHDREAKTGAAALGTMSARGIRTVEAFEKRAGVHRAETRSAVFDREH